MTTAGNAAVIKDLGINPTSSAGAFSNQNLPTGAFADQYTFQLVGEQFITIGSATNVYPGGLPSTDFISGFNGSVYEIVGGVDLNPGGGGLNNDLLVLGPDFGGPGCGADCQILGGSAILDAGFYYLNIAGNAGSTAGYGGNLAVRAVPAVPEPATWAMMLLGFAGVVVMGARNRRRQERNFRLA